MYLNILLSSVNCILVALRVTLNSVVYNRIVIHSKITGVESGNVAETQLHLGEFSSQCITDHGNKL